MTPTLEKARQDAARAAERLAEAQQRAAEAEAAAAERRQERERQWAKAQTEQFERRNQELLAARTTTRRAFREAVVDRGEPGIRELFEVAKVEADIAHLHRRLGSALGFLGENTWQGGSIPYPSLREVTYPKLIDEVVAQAIGDYAADLDDELDREIRDQVWGEDAPEGR